MGSFVVLGLLLYCNTLKVPFYFDDDQNIVSNPHIQMGVLSLAALKKAAFDSRLPTRPVSNISFAITYYFGHYDPTWYHAVNIVVHIATGILLYLLIVAILQSPAMLKQGQFRAPLALLGALLWFVNPVQTQSVTYIVQRMTSMAAMFYILSLWLYVKGRLAAGHGRKWPWFAGCAGAGLLAVGCKEMTAILPFVILLFEWFFFQDLSPDWFRKAAPYIAISLLFFVILVFAYLGFSPFQTIMSIYKERSFSISQRVLTEFRVVLYYLSLVFFPLPSRLNLDYDFPLSCGLAAPLSTLWSMGVVAGLVVVGILVAKRNRLLAFAIFWYFINLVIESSVIPLELVYEHRLYLPSMLLFTGALAIGYRLVRHRQIISVTASIAIVLLGFWTYKRNTMWADPVALWADCVKKSPGKARPHTNLGLALAREGKLDEAIAQYTKALSIEGNYVVAHNNLGAVLLLKGDVREAVAHFTRVLELDPNNEDSRKNLQMALKQIGRSPDRAEGLNMQAIVLAGQGKYQEAIQRFSQALGIKHDFPEAHYNLANAYAAIDKLDEAIFHYSEAIRLREDYAGAYNNLGIVLARQGKLSEAISHFVQALRIRPNYAEAKNNMERATRQLHR